MGLLGSGNTNPGAPTLPQSRVSRIASILRQVGAVASIVIGAVLSSTVIPTAVRTVLVVIGGVILAIEHTYNGNTG